MIGDPAHFAFEIAWTLEPPDAKGLAWGKLVLWVGGHPVWSGNDRAPIHWTWIDLVEHLARAWGHLRYEENAPFGLVAQTPALLREKRLLRSVRGTASSVVEDAVHAFQHRHDLAAGLNGISLPAVWLVREGASMRIHADARDTWRPLDEVLGVLTGVVDAIRDRTKATSVAPRAREALDRWSTREPSDDLRLRLRSGLSQEQLRSWIPRGKRTTEWWGTANDETPMLAVARLSQPLKEATRKRVVEAIGLTPKRKTEELDKLTDEALPVLEAVADQVAYAQGYTLAQWLRTKLGIDGRLDPKKLLTGWNVHVRDLPGLEPALDAVACWGRRGPAVLVNPKGKHASSVRGRNATLAHEIAHLILDRGRALPLAEVFGGATPLILEKRAKAFAAELLLPRELAWSAVAKQSSLVSAVRHLQEEFGVSREVVAWQVKNSTGQDLLDPRETKMIRLWTSKKMTLVE